MLRNPSFSMFVLFCFCFVLFFNNEEATDQAWHRSTCLTISCWLKPQRVSTNPVSHYCYVIMVMRLVYVSQLVILIVNNLNVSHGKALQSSSSFCCFKLIRNLKRDNTMASVPKPTQTDPFGLNGQKCLFSVSFPIG